MSKRNYGQACSVARFLDLLGSRWTLLIVRDLLARPRRFKELLASAPSMGPNLLTTRLGVLSEEGIVEKSRIDGQAEQYQLTDRGRALEPVIREMVRWSLNHIAVDPDEPGVARPDLLPVAFKALFDPARAEGVKEVYEFQVDGEVFHLDVAGGQVTTRSGPARNPACVVKTSAQTLDLLGTRTISIDTARTENLIAIEGDESAFARFAETFGTR